MESEAKRLVFLDIETTGLSPKSERITEIGALVYEDGKLIKSYSTLINPEVDIPYYITQMTGIDNAMVRNAPTFREIAQELRGLLFDRIFVAHNAQFDYSFIQSEFLRLDHDFQEIRLCTAKLARRLYPQHRKHGLDQIIEICGVDCKNRHRAYDDAQVLMHFYEHIHKNFSHDILFPAWEKSMTRLLN